MDEEPLEFLYEDDMLVIVSKPPGMAVHPSPRHPTGSLIQRLRALLRPTGANVKLAHRIDRETSGIVVATKDDESNDLMHRQFRERGAHKVYLALVEGHVEPAEGEIKAPLLLPKDSRLRVKIEVRPDGAPSATRYRTISVLPHHTLIEAVPITGRQHQIRAHFAHIGHPLVGDKVYGPDEQWFLDHLNGRLSAAAIARLGMDRHALHAHRLTLVHPWWELQLEVVAPLPADIREFMRRAQQQAG